jgi:hypothetical protein
MSCGKDTNQAPNGKSKTIHIGKKKLQTYKSTCSNKNTCANLSGDLKQSCENLLNISLLPYNSKITTCKGGFDPKTEQFNQFLDDYVLQVFADKKLKPKEKRQVIKDTLSNILCQAQTGILDYDPKGKPGDDQFKDTRPIVKNPSEYIQKTAMENSPELFGWNQFITWIAIVLSCIILALSILSLPKGNRGWYLIPNIFLFALYITSLIFNSSLLNHNVNDYGWMIAPSIVSCLLPIAVIFLFIIITISKEMKSIFITIFNIIIIGTFLISLSGMVYINPNASVQSIYTFISLLISLNLFYSIQNNNENSRYKFILMGLIILFSINMSTSFFEITARTKDPTDNINIGAPLTMSFIMQLAIYISVFLLILIKSINPKDNTESNVLLIKDILKPGFTLYSAITGFTLYSTIGSFFYRIYLAIFDIRNYNLITRVQEQQQ